MKFKLSRREFLKAGMLSLLAPAGAATLGKFSINAQDPPPPQYESGGDHGHGAMGTVGTVSHNRFDPMDMLYDYDYGQVSKLSNGQTLREYEFRAVDLEVEIAPGVFFPAWVYGSLTSPESQRLNAAGKGDLVGRVPGPTIRCVEGDRIRINFINTGTHPHTIHFHGIHSAAMDGIPGIGDGLINPGDSTIYEFDAAPFGCHLYHCHSFPLHRHTHKGLYGAFIVHPDPDKYSGWDKKHDKTRNH